ncbi:gluconokinase [Spongiimicrobium salis]|uniref:gluconokinase n=1 Tax=Spongiimicrobium salis TaxID=1667022 RepID=UPI00374D3D3D
MRPTNLFFVMGVSGCGKSTVGSALAEKLSIPFFDGDDYHPQANIDKMKQGTPLNDDDRHGWLVQLNKLAKEHLSTGAVIACSALKEAYRVLLQKDIEDHIVFVFLEGSFDEIMQRMQSRKNHFMPAQLLKSQFDTLEIPKNALRISIAKTPEEIVSIITGKTA